MACCLFLAITPGCGDSVNSAMDAGADDGSPDAADTAPTDADKAAAGPEFLSFGTSSTSMTENQSVTFTAVVTDPDGIDDVIGGTLVSPDGQKTYGAFATSASEGAYSLTLSWADLSASSPINFDQESIVTFVAEFFDQAGHMASRSVPIRLHCEGDASCDGVCIDLQTNSENCGACGMKCQEPCDQGRCHGRAPCFLAAATTTCDAHCTTLGSVCAPDGCGPAALVYTSENDCLIISPVDYVAIYECNADLWSGSDSWATCCCTP